LRYRSGPSRSWLKTKSMVESEVASLLPKDVNLNVNNVDSLTDEQLLARLAQLTEMAKPLLAKLEADRDRAGSLPALMERPRYQVLVMTRREGSGLARRMDPSIRMPFPALRSRRQRVRMMGWEEGSGN
jgi:hypothetical protein